MHFFKCFLKSMYCFQEYCYIINYFTIALIERVFVLSCRECQKRCWLDFHLSRIIRSLYYLVISLGSCMRTRVYHICLPQHHNQFLICTTDHTGSIRIECKCGNMFNVETLSFALVKSQYRCIRHAGRRKFVSGLHRYIAISGTLSFKRVGRRALLPLLILRSV